MAEKKILIVGSGFGGIRCALDLAERHIDGIKITLVNPTPHFEYHATLYRLLTGRSPLETCIPLREIFSHKRNVEVVEDFITDVQFRKNEALGNSGSKYHYDYLVLGLGSETAYYDIPGLKGLSFTLKSVTDALKLKRHLHELFSSHVIVVGGGATGVELAGELAFYTKKVAEHHLQNIPLLEIDLITSSERLVPQLPIDISIGLSRRLRDLGVNLYFNRRVSKEEVDEVYMKDMSIKSKTVIWAAGVEGNELYRKIGLPVNKKGQVIVDKYLQPLFSNIKHLSSNIYIIGDGADTEFSGMAETAIQHGKLTAENIVRSIHGQPDRLELWHIDEPIYAIPAGNNWAAVSMYGMNFYGRVGWSIRRFMQLQFLFSILPFSKALTAWREDGILWESCPVCREEVL